MTAVDSSLILTFNDFFGHCSLDQLRHNCPIRFETVTCGGTPMKSRMAIPTQEWISLLLVLGKSFPPQQARGFAHKAISRISIRVRRVPTGVPRFKRES